MADTPQSPALIDAYAHCGISKFLPVAEVLAAMGEAGVERAVLCQHLGEYDNRYLAQVVEQHSGRFAAACMVNPEGPVADKRLQEWRATGYFRGLRILAEWLQQYPALCREAVDLGMNLVVYAPEGISPALPHIQELVRQRPQARIIISHLGNPKVEDGRLVVGSELFALQSEPGVYVQLSGLSMFCEYPYTPFHDFVSEVVRRFGPSRVMWGSNFPVCGDRQAYRRDLAWVQSNPWGFEPDVINRILGVTARGLWFD